MKEFLRQNIVSVIAFTLLVGGAWVTLNDLKGNTVSKDVYEAEKLQWQTDIQEVKAELKEVKELNNKILVDVAVISTNVQYLRDEWDNH